jgi:hypothetical protein
MSPHVNTRRRGHNDVRVRWRTAGRESSVDADRDWALRAFNSTHKRSYLRVREQSILIELLTEHGELMRVVLQHQTMLDAALCANRLQQNENRTK